MDMKQRAERARALLCDDLLNEAIEEIRQRQIKAFTGCDPSDTDGMRDARLKLWAVEQVVGELTHIVSTNRIHNKSERSAP